MELLPAINYLGLSVQQVKMMARRETRSATVQRSVAGNLPNAGISSNVVPDPGNVPSVVAATNEAGFIGAVRAAASLAGIPFKDNASPEDLLIAILRKRDPTRLPEEGQSGQALQIPTSRSMKSASRLAEDHAIVRREMTVDPFLEELFKLRKISCAPGSLRQDLSGDMPLVTRPNAKISAVNIGDAVVYQEPGKEQTVLGGVTAIIAQPTRKGGITLALKVHRLYQFQELREIFDNLAMYRDNPKLKDVDFRKVGENDPLVHDVEYQAAKRLYDQMEANVAQCFAGFPGLHHKVLVTALSDWTTTIAPEMVHEVLHLTLNSKVLENIGPSPDSEWPEKNADAIRMLSGVTVLWTSFLNTKTWTLHPVNLPPEAMTGRVLSAAARSMYWSPQGAVWGMVGTFRRYIDGRLKALGRHCSNQRQAVLSVPCSFNLLRSW